MTGLVAEELHARSIHPLISSVRVRSAPLLLFSTLRFIRLYEEAFHSYIPTVLYSTPALLCCMCILYTLTLDLSFPSLCSSSIASASSSSSHRPPDWRRSGNYLRAAFFLSFSLSFSCVALHLCLIMQQCLCDAYSCDTRLCVVYRIVLPEIAALPNRAVY